MSLGCIKFGQFFTELFKFKIDSPVSYTPGSRDAPVSYTPESCAFEKLKYSPMSPKYGRYRRVETLPSTVLCTGEYSWGFSKGICHFKCVTFSALLVTPVSFLPTYDTVYITVRVLLMQMQNLYTYIAIFKLIFN